MGASISWPFANWKYCLVMSWTLGIKMPPRLLIYVLLFLPVGTQGGWHYSPPLYLHNNPLRWVRLREVTNHVFITKWGFKPGSQIFVCHSDINKSQFLNIFWSIGLGTQDCRCIPFWRTRNISFLALQSRYLHWDDPKQQGWQMALPSGPCHRQAAMQNQPQSHKISYTFGRKKHQNLFDGP